MDSLIDKYDFVVYYLECMKLCFYSLLLLKILDHGFSRRLP